MSTTRKALRQTPMAYRCSSSRTVKSAGVVQVGKAALRCKFNQYKENMRRSSFVLMFVAFFCVGAVAQVPLSPAGDGHLTVPVTANGAGPFPFILDTGADETGVYQWFAEQLHLPSGQPEELIGQTGSSQAPTYKLKSVTMDGRSLRDIAADGLPNRRDKGKQAGILGNDMMDGAIAIFDFPCGTVQLLPKPVDMRKLLGGDIHAVRAGLVKNGTELTLPVTLNGVRGLAVLDTGSRDTRINSKFAAAAHIDTSSADFKDADLIYGVSSKAMSSRKGPIGTIGFAGVEVKAVQGRVMDLFSFQTFGMADAPAMTLGADVMSGFRLVYDHQEKRVWFLHSACTR
jgi:predicted aspartyl protease